MRLDRLIQLGDEDFTALSKLLEHKITAKKGRDIIVEGYEPKGLYIVENGFVLRYKLLHSGKRQVLGLGIPGDIVGFPACFFKTAIISAMAVEKSSLHQISIHAFAALCLEKPRISTALIWLAAQEAAVLAEHVTDVGRRDPLERLAHFLLETHARLRTIGLASDTSFEMPLSQESIGDAVGLSAPHVNRMLAELRREATIAIKGREITLLDVAALQVLAEFRYGFPPLLPILDHHHP